MANPHGELQYVRREIITLNQVIEQAANTLSKKSAILVEMKEREQRLMVQLGLVDAPETMTNEEAQEAVESGEAEIPADSVIPTDSPMRLHQLAKRLGVQNNELIDAFNELGVEGKKPVSNVSPDEIKLLLNSQGGDK